MNKKSFRKLKYEWFISGLNIDIVLVRNIDIMLFTQVTMVTITMVTVNFKSRGNCFWEKKSLFKTRNFYNTEERTNKLTGTWVCYDKRYFIIYSQSHYRQYAELERKHRNLDLYTNRKASCPFALLFPWLNCNVRTAKMSRFRHWADWPFKSGKVSANSFVFDVFRNRASPEFSSLHQKWVPQIVST